MRTLRRSMQRECITYAPTAERRAQERARCHVRILIPASQGGIGLDRGDKGREGTTQTPVHRSERISRRVENRHRVRESGCMQGERERRRHVHVYKMVHASVPRSLTSDFRPPYMAVDPFVYFRFTGFHFSHLSQSRQMPKEERGKKESKEQLVTRYVQQHSELITKSF